MQNPKKKRELEQLLAESKDMADDDVFGLATLDDMDKKFNQYRYEYNSKFGGSIGVETLKIDLERKSSTAIPDTPQRSNFMSIIKQASPRAADSKDSDI